MLCRVPFAPRDSEFDGPSAHAGGPSLYSRAEQCEHPHARPASRWRIALRPGLRALSFAFVASLVLPSPALAQITNPPALKAGVVAGSIHIDGVLDEPAWAAAPAIDNLTMWEPTLGGAPTGRTRVRVLANRKVIIIGIDCDDPSPQGIVSHTKVRDASLSTEDNVTVVLGTSRDGRYGYVFAVNPGGARYDALIDPDGTSVNANWDGIWESATHRDGHGWSVEMRIPVATLSFKKDLTSWDFNVERRVQRLLESDRWASPSRDVKVTQTSRAGLLEGLPDFDLGNGVSIRPSITGGGGKPAPDAALSGTLEPSLDLTKRLGPNLLGSVTVNTDFAETEVDTRRTNFTRFPLLFPEKRTFFLEGSNIFGFGLALKNFIVPYYSRRIGLVSGQEVPISFGGKINGRSGSTNMGVQLVRTRSVADLTPGDTMGVIRIKQNVFAESSVGMIATMGDPLGRKGSWLAGGDFTYQTSHFLGDKNFAVGLWGMAMGREGLGNDRTAKGISIEYPNDNLQFWIRARLVGKDFDPSLGFIELPGGERAYDSKWIYRIRGAMGLRQMIFEGHERLWTDLDGHLRSAEFFFSPWEWVFESGDTLEVDGSLNTEHLDEPFEVSPGVTLQPGRYHFNRYRIDAITARKRPLSGELAWWFGQFYNGTLHEITLTGNWSPTPLLTMELSAERDIGRLPAGNFVQSLFGTRLRFNVSPDLQVSSYVQYDSVSRSFGTNNRLRWTIRSFGDLFVIYNHNVRDEANRWRFDSNQLLVKFRYTFRY